MIFSSFDLLLTFVPSNLQTHIPSWVAMIFGVRNSNREIALKQQQCAAVVFMSVFVKRQNCLVQHMPYTLKIC